MSVDLNDVQVGFARKYRPGTWGGYIGNEDVKRTIMNTLKSGYRPQTILIKGHSGCGKTTLSRIIAKEYCCEDRNPETGACGECQTCQMFDQYIVTGDNSLLPDIYEIDASESSKKDISNMLESMEYPAQMGDWKVYIIDEAHLLSGAAEGRLLKSLEEPPEGTLIILCTTNPEDLLDTIRNRCQLQLQITKPTTKNIIDLLQRVCLAEDKNYDLNGLRMIASQADNVVRDSLNGIERVFNTHGDATAASVSLEFNQVADTLLFDFLKAYLEKDFVSYISIMYDIKVDIGFDQFLLSLSSFITRGIYIINSVEVEGISAEELKSYMDLFSKFSPLEISRVLSRIRSMNSGNIEANLMAFIYDDDSTRVLEGASKAVGEEVSLVDERKLRNNNLQKLEQAKMANAEKSISSEMEKVSLMDMGNLFTFEKVD